MSDRPQRQSKAPERFQVWKMGEKHEPFTVRNEKKQIKIEAVKKKEYQANYRERKKVDNQDKAENIEAENEMEGMDSKTAEKSRKKAERKNEILEYQRQYRAKLKADKAYKKEKQRIYQEQYRKIKKNEK